TGKELVARAIHFTGIRKDKPFIAENCAALPESLLESELFGYTKGAFTGADRDKKGLFELAHEGTLFLDEIGDMSAGMQAKLLRVLQDGQFRPIGGKEPVRTDVRILTASNRNLTALVEEGKFREDLFYRLNVISITMPPLRNRKEDIPLLVETLAGEVAKREKAKPMKFVTGAMRRLLLHNWPGNVRELQNVIEKTFVVTSGKVVSEADVEMSLPTEQSTIETAGVPVELGFKKGCEQFARDYLVRLLREAKGNVTRAAAAGKITRQHMHYFLRKYSINYSQPNDKPRKTNSE
ncbi:MAG: sigma 54-interacting transcriptional regulator, partial [Planctomycetota bacterium]